MYNGIPHTAPVARDNEQIVKAVIPMAIFTIDESFGEYV